MLESIKMELDGNDLLLEDFPEVCFPIQCLDGIANRCNGTALSGGADAHRLDGQGDRAAHDPRHGGQRGDHQGGGITGRIRGMKYKRADGHSVRPSLVVLDDPQTDESAGRRRKCRTRTDSGGRGAGSGRPRQEDCRHHALHGDPPRRHGRQHSRPRQAPGVERRADQDGLRLPDRREALGRSTPRSAPESLRSERRSRRRPSSTASQPRRRWTRGP